jgi:hypothetical protein
VRSERDEEQERGLHMHTRPTPLPPRDATPHERRAEQAAKIAQAKDDTYPIGGWSKCRHRGRSGYWDAGV